MTIFYRLIIIHNIIDIFCIVLLFFLFSFYGFYFVFQKEEKIQAIKQKLAERDALKGTTTTSRCRSQPKQSFIVADYPTGEGTSDSAIGGGISICTKSSRASASDVEFSETYL